MDPHPYHIVITRRVTDEEQVSVELHHPDADTAHRDLDDFLAQLKRYRDAHNAAVLDIHAKQVERIESTIERRGDDLRRLQDQIDAKVAELRTLTSKVDRRAQVKSA